MDLLTFTAHLIYILAVFAMGVVTGYTCRAKLKQILTNWHKRN